MGLAVVKTTYLSEQDYLEAEKVSDVKHEYFDGEIFAMSGEKANHQRITMNVEIEISRKSTDWHSSYYFLGDDMTFE